MQFPDKAIYHWLTVNQIEGRKTQRSVNLKYEIIIMLLLHESFAQRRQVNDQFIYYLQLHRISKVTLECYALKEMKLHCTLLK